MSKNTNRKGLALGAMFSLVATLFVGATPATANVASNAFTFAAAGADSTTFATLVDDDFTLITQRNPSVVSAADFEAYLKYSVTTTRTWNSTHSIHVSTSVAANTAADDLSGLAASEVAATRIHGVGAGTAASEQRIYYRAADGGVGVEIPRIVVADVSSSASGTIPGTVGSAVPATQAFVVKPITTDSDLDVDATANNKISFRMFGANLSTVSPSIDISVTAFLDLNGNNVWDTSTEPHATQTISFKRYSEVAPTTTLGAVDAGGNHATASATFTGLNMDQIRGKFALRFTQWTASGQTNASFSANAERTVTRALGNSFSDTITLASAGTAGNTISVQVVYISASANVLVTPGVAVAAASTMWPLRTITIDGGSAVATAQTLYAVKGANVNEAGLFRPNTVFSVRFSASQVVSSAEIPVTFTFGHSGSLSEVRTISIDGGTPKTSGTASAVTKNTNTSGVATITVLTSGFAAGETITVSAKVQGQAIISITATAQSPTYTVTRDSATVATTPGGSVFLGYTVTDQWEQNVEGGRLKLAWTAGYAGTATTSFTGAVVAGKVSATLTHANLPATSTVSGSVLATYQTYSTANNLWSDTSGTATVEVIVTNNANSFRQGLLATYSASISYGADFTWSATIERAFVVVTGSQVVATGTGLIFKDVVTGKTASDTITLQSNGSANVRFQVTGRLAGEYRVTLTAGTSSTSTLVTLDDAAATAGKNIAFDLSSMTSGRAAIVTGTLTDANGNPVETSGDASIQLTVTGAGAAFVGSLATETTAAGKFSVALLSGAGDLGTVTITATYYPTAGAVAADRVTKVHTVSVVAPVAPEVNAVIGSFNGRWAVRVENARGSVVSVKAGNRWVKFTALNNNYLYSMRSVKGRTIAVSVWVDGELQNSQTITIK